MNSWYMVTLVGADRPGIVARVTRALFDADCNLGEASMVRLGGNFTIMLMVQPAASGQRNIESILAPVAENWALHLHVDAVEGLPAEAIPVAEPDYRITVYGADRPGIVAQVTEVLAALDFNILDLESDVAEGREAAVYLLHIEGQCDADEASLQAALEGVRRQGVEVAIGAVQTLVG